MCEFLDREEFVGRKERDHLKSYLGIRKEIIKSLNPGLSDDKIGYLGAITRGMNENDAKKAVNEYLSGGIINLRQKYPKYLSNICDPYTGNWSEYLMDIYQLRDILISENFQADICCGYYGDANTLPKCLQVVF
jgi:hypothetical protein